MKAALVLLISLGLVSACATKEALSFDYGEQSPDLMDDDKDGVVNARDLCGGTKEGIKVSHDGCAFWEQVEDVKEAVIFFDFDSDQVRVEHVEDIKAVIAYVASHDNSYILVEGHTSSVGSDEYNEQLQRRRSNAVKELLLQEGAAADKLRMHEQGKVSQRVTVEESEAAHAVNQRVFIRAVRAEESMQTKWTIYSSDKE